ncbi:MAG: hypothetical protein EPN93_00560 [Spirochaetes bacterium]|nr:MAG: hypothetical protein EPN93_00560 [Spirochaetota bacterium]
MEQEERVIHKGKNFMMKRGLKKIIIEDVNKLSLGQQKKLHEYARAMLVSRPMGSSGSELLRFSGSFDKKSIKEMKEALHECERLDHDE